MSALSPRQWRSIHVACASIVLLLTLLAVSASSNAQGGAHTLQARVVGASGTPLSDHNWPVNCTIGSIGPIVRSTAAGLRLDGGFWHAAGVVSGSDRIFRNGFD